MTLLTFGLLLTGCTPTDSATWRYEAADPVETVGNTPDDTDDEAEDLEYEKLMWGVLEGEEAWTGFYYADPDAGGELCEMAYEADWVTTTGCPDCLEAWTITRGVSEIWSDVEGTCGAEGWTGLEGTDFSVGYDAETVWADLGAGWQAIEEADGEREDDFTFFEIWL